MDKTVRDRTVRKPTYSIEERVEVCGWTGKGTGIIEDIREIYHLRLNEYTWGYKIKMDNKQQLFSFNYIPEGYLRKLNEISEPSNKK